MKQPSTFNMPRLVIAAIVLIILSTGLLFWGREVVREVVVIPLSYLFWGIGVLVRTTPQIFFWISALLIASMIAYHTLSGRKKLAEAGPVALDDAPTGYTSGRAVFWVNKVNLLRAGQGGYAESNFYTAVTRLLVEMLAYRYRLPARTIEDQVRDGSLDIPPQVTHYMQTHLIRTERSPVGFWTLARRSLLEWARAMWQKLTKGSAPGSAQSSAIPQPAGDDAELAYILDYMEEELEVPHDDTGH